LPSDKIHIIDEFQKTPSVEFKARFIHKLVKNKNPTYRPLFQFLFELKSQIRIEIFVLYGKVDDSSGFYFCQFESK
jgi:hypothetical protein